MLTFEKFTSANNDAEIFRTHMNARQMNLIAMALEALADNMSQTEGFESLSKQALELSADFHNTK